MYQYTDFDRQFVQLRAQQFRDQLERWQRGELTDEQLLPLHLQNGWYIQRYAPTSPATTTSRRPSCWPTRRPRRTSCRPPSRA